MAESDSPEIEVAQEGAEAPDKEVIPEKSGPVYELDFRSIDRDFGPTGEFGHFLNGSIEAACSALDHCSPALYDPGEMIYQKAMLRMKLLGLIETNIQMIQAVNGGYLVETPKAPVVPLGPQEVH